MIIEKILNFLQSAIEYNMELSKPRERTTLELLGEIIEEVYTPTKKEFFEGMQLFDHRYSDVTIMTNTSVETAKLKASGMKVTTKFCWEESGGSYIVDRDSFNRFFKRSDFAIYVEKKIKPIYEFLLDTDLNFGYLYAQFNTPMLTVLNTIRESKEENNGIITQEVADLSTLILESFFIEAWDKKEEHDKLEELMFLATNDNHINRLHGQLKYINEFVKGDIWSDIEK